MGLFNQDIELSVKNAYLTRTDTDFYNKWVSEKITRCKMKFSILPGDILMCSGDSDVLKLELSNMPNKYLPFITGIESTQHWVYIRGNNKCYRGKLFNSIKCRRLNINLVSSLRDFNIQAESCSIRHIMHVYNTHFSGDVSFTCITSLPKLHNCTSSGNKVDFVLFENTQIEGVLKDILNTKIPVDAYKINPIAWVAPCDYKLEDIINISKMTPNAMTILHARKEAPGFFCIDLIKTDKESQSRVEGWNVFLYNS